MVLVLFAGCHLGPQTPSSSLPGSMLQYDVSYFEGSPLSGDKPADSHSLRLEDTFGIIVTFVAMNPWSENTLEPVASQTQMITVLPANTAVTAVAQLMKRARVGVIQSETQFLEQITVKNPDVPLPVETLCGILPNGVGARFRILERPTVDSGAIRTLEIQLRRRLPQEPESQEPSATGISLEISLVATGIPKPVALPDGDNVASSGKEQKQSVSAVTSMLTTETILLTPQVLQEQDRLAIVLSSPFTGEEIAAFAALIEVKPPPQKGTAEAVAYTALLKQCQDYLLAAAEVSGRKEGPQFDAGRQGIEDAIQLLQSPAHKQRALLYLTQETGAPLMEDIALSATDIVVDQLAQAITNEYVSGSSFETDKLGWRLEKVTYQLLVKLMSADQPSPELEAILIRHTGEVGRHPSVLEEMISDAISIKDLEQRLLLENSIYLEDISPAARVRAFEWLVAKGQAPEGYDPLASLKERRSVLNRILQEQE